MVDHSAGDAVVTRITELGVIAVVRADTADAAVRISNTLMDVGVHVIEVTFTVSNAVQAIESLASDALVGAGTVLTVSQAKLAVAAGARFLVSPGFDPGVGQVAHAAGVLYVPGVLTPTEVAGALKAGFRVLKLFPARMAGIDGMRALAEPFPDVRFIPTGGVQANDLADWLRAGAIAVGLGSYLTRSTNPADRAREALGAVATARAQAFAPVRDRSEV